MKVTSNPPACLGEPGLKTPRNLAVQLGMKLGHILLILLGALTAGDAPLAQPRVPRTFPSPHASADLQERCRATANLASWTRDIEAESGTARSAGNLWIEVNRLKRGGQNVRPIEWYVSDLEGTLRRHPQDASAKRHLLNNLDHEIGMLQRRSR